MIELEREACQKRLQDLGEKQVLLVQDTTDFNFAKAPKAENLAEMYELGRSFFAHSSLAVSLQGVPLGLLEQKVWQRPAPQEKKNQCPSKPADSRKRELQVVGRLREQFKP